MRRRDFMKLAAASTLWIPRVSRAATPAFGAAKRIVILFARGGLRSHATFNAGVAFRHNPFGTQPAAPGTEWTLGAACGSADLGAIPAFAKMTNEVAVIPCVDHEPNDRPVVDHLDGTIRIGTGARDGTVGLLSLIGKHHPALAAGWPADRAPPVELGASPFGFGSGAYRTVRPLSIASARTALVSDPTLGQGKKIDARRVLDAAFRDRAPSAYAERIEGWYGAKENAYRFASLLASPLLALDAHRDAAAGGFTNGELLEIFGEETPRLFSPRWGYETALAVRFLAMGSPAVVITRGNFDFHDRENELYGPATADLVRQLAGLRHVLGAMNLWSDTIVAVVSEMSRNNGSAATGFNSGFGSDHVEVDAAPMRNQAIALMGGPITARGRSIGATDGEVRAIGPVFSSRSLLATFLDVLGIDSSPHFGDPPIRELFT